MTIFAREPGRGLRAPHTVLVVGSGAREHALCWKLAAEAGVKRVLVAPGNAGMGDVAETVPQVAAGDGAGLLELCGRERVDLVVIGPEGPLVDGVGDRLRTAGVATFGPDAAAAQIEGSKAFCRDIADAAGIPMAEGKAFDRLEPAYRYGQGLGLPVVVKADGLAAGKGVSICRSSDQLRAALADALDEQLFGPAGARVVVERALEGDEASVIAICDARNAICLPAARDHKRLGDADTGPNTGGMGAYSPLDDLPDEAAATVVRRFHLPALRELAARGAPFRGALYAGLMLTPQGPRLLEFNARLGDPETQAMVPRLDVPLAALLLAAAEDRLGEAAAALGIPVGSVLRTKPDATVAVVLAAPGYPASPLLGEPVAGLAEARVEGATVFSAGVARASGAVGVATGPTVPGGDGLVTAGGRVVTVVGRGRALEEAREQAYRAADRITFPGRQLRRDIGLQRVAINA